MLKKKEKNGKTIKKNMPLKNLVFIDESGVNIDMTRIYGRARGKERVNDYVPLNTQKNTTLLSSIRLEQTLAKTVFTGALNGDIFLDYIRNILVPTLHEGDIVVMDNLRCHKVKEAIESVGAFVVYLPPYSPDFNPIEMMWSKIKSLLRKWKARSADLLDNAIENAFKEITADDILGWFFKTGYCL